MFNIFKKQNKEFKKTYTFIDNFIDQHDILKIVSGDNESMLKIELNTKIKIDIGTYDYFQSNKQLSYIGTVSDIFKDCKNILITIDCSEDCFSKIVNIYINSNSIKVYEDNDNKKLKIKLKDARILFNDIHHVSLNTDKIYIEKIISRIIDPLHVGDIIKLEPIHKDDDIITARIKKIGIPLHFNEIFERDKIDNNIGVSLDVSQYNKSIILESEFIKGTNQVNILKNGERHKYTISLCYSCNDSSFRNIRRLSDYEKH